MSKTKRKSSSTIIKVLLWIGKAIAKAGNITGGMLLWIGKATLVIIKFIVNTIKLIATRWRKNKEKTTIEKSRKANPPQKAEWRELESLEGKWPDFEKKLASSKSLIGMILGARGSGKTALGMALVENLAAQSKKSIYAMGFMQNDLPPWITPITDISTVENNAIILADEGAIQYSSRRSMTDANKVLSDLLFISRHKDLTILFIAQNSSTIEVNTLRQADFLILKPSSLLQKDFERKKIKELYDEVAPLFKKYQSITGLTYIYSDWYRGFVKNPLPSFWSTNMSKSYRAKVI